jgi:hypothetical protein
MLQTLNISYTKVQKPSLYSSNIQVNKNKTWNSSIYPTMPILRQPLPHFLDYQTNIPLKVLSQQNYYTNDSFKPPKELPKGIWKLERAGYGIFNHNKNMIISQRLPSL